MRWTGREREARQGAMFDVMLGEIVEPLERVAPSEVGSQRPEPNRPAQGGPGSGSLVNRAALSREEATQERIDNA